MTEKELNKNYIRGIVEASNNNKELFVNEIQKLCSKQYQKGLEQGKFDATMDAQQHKESLIKYLEDMLDGTINDEFIVVKVKDILEKVRSSKYE